MIPGQQEIGLGKGMSTDQEIRHHAAALPSSKSVHLPDLIGQKGCLQFDGAELYPEPIQGISRGMGGCAAMGWRPRESEWRSPGSLPRKMVRARSIQWQTSSRAQLPWIITKRQPVSGLETIPIRRKGRR